MAHKVSWQKQNLQEGKANSRQDNRNSRLKLNKLTAKQSQFTAKPNELTARQRQFFTEEVKCHGGCNLITIPIQTIICFCELWRNLWKMMCRMSTWSYQKTSSAIISSGASSTKRFVCFLQENQAKFPHSPILHYAYSPLLEENTSANNRLPLGLFALFSRSLFF